MKKPTINPVKTPDVSLNKSIAAVKEIIEIREGDRGDPDERFVRVKDLVDSGIATKVVLPGGVFRDESGDPGFVGANDGDDTDGAITVFDVVSGVADFSLSENFFSIMLTWTYPDYRGHAYTEIYRSPSAATGSEQWLARAHGSMYVDSVDPQSTHYYWVRHVSLNGEEGPLDPVGAGLKGTTSKTVADMLTEAGETIVASGLATSLLSSFNSTQYVDDAPSSKQDGRALIAGDKYVTSTKDEYIYTGSAWIKTTIDTSGFLTEHQDLPDLSGYLTSHQSLSGYATTASLSSYATTTSVANNVSIYYTTNSSTITGQKTGDVWVDTSTTSFTVGAITYNNQIKYDTYRWTTTGWLAFESSEIDRAIKSAANAASIANGKSKIHITLSKPALTYSDAGDMWLDPNTDQIEFWNGNSWTDLDYVNAAAVTTKITEQVGYCSFVPHNGTGDIFQPARNTKVSCEIQNSSAGTYVWNASGAIAEKALTAFSTANGFSTTIGTHTGSINGLFGYHQVKIENNGRVTGFGLSSTTNPTNLTVDTAFIINADKFAVMSSTDTSGKTTSPSSVNTPFIVKTIGSHVLKRYTSPSYRAGWEVSANRSDNGTGAYYVTDEGSIFWNSSYVTSYNNSSSVNKTDANGTFIYVWVPAKTEVALNADTYIKKASIGAAQIQGVLSTSILKVNGHAWINIADIDAATIDQLTISGVIKNSAWNGLITYSNATSALSTYAASTSANALSTGSAGFYIDKYHCYFNGDTTFGNDVTINGTLDTATIKTGSKVIDETFGYELLTSSSIYGELTSTPSFHTFSSASLNAMMAARGTMALTGLPGVMTVLYGSEFGTDTSLSIRNRLKSSEALINIVASAVVAHDMSLWYRAKYTSGTNEYGDWNFLRSSYTPEPSYGPITLTWGLLLPTYTNDLILQLGVAPISGPNSAYGSWGGSLGLNWYDRDRTDFRFLNWIINIHNF